jgi:hypothetical protein
VEGFAVRARSKINKIIIHCAATPNGSDSFTIAEIDKWHGAKGWRRKVKATRGQGIYQHVGYHWVIHVDGTVHKGRTTEEVGTHCKGMNTRSIGICMIGTDAFTPAQWSALSGLVQRLEDHLNGLGKPRREVAIHGHNEFSSKTCPGFDVQAWRAGGMGEMVGHVC